jgi:hypothetical protein
VAAELFAELVALAHEEHALVAGARYDELPQLHARRDAVMAALPPVVPAAARPQLHEAMAVQGLVTEALRVARDAAGAELATVRHTRRGVAGYAASTGRPATLRASFDQRH